MSVTTFLLFLFSVVTVPLVSLLLVYAVRVWIFDPIVNPSFERRPRRYFYLSLAFFLFSLLILVTFDLFGEHFHISILDSQFAFMLPAFMYLLLRGTVRLQSARMANDHANSLVFLAAVFFSIKIGYSIVSNESPFLETRMDVPSFGPLFLAALIIPTVADLGLEWVSKIGKVNDHINASTRLIELTEQLPISIEFMFGKETIDKKIADILHTGNGELCIITNTYTTVAKNLAAIKRRKAKGDKVRILGDKNNYENPSKEVSARILSIESEDFLLCSTSFDKIRLIVDCNQRVLLSFATSSWSHVAVYSEHPFVVSLFRSYFDTKCRSVTCREKCATGGSAQSG